MHVLQYKFSKKPLIFLGKYEHGKQPEHAAAPNCKGLILPQIIHDQLSVY